MKLINKINQEKNSNQKNEDQIWNKK
jgi:hypothetical protein